MTEKAPTKTEILGVVEAQADSLKELSERLVKMETLSDRLVTIETLTENQEKRNQNILYAVLFAVVLIVFSVGVSVMLSNRTNESSAEKAADKVNFMQNQNLDELNGLEIKVNDLSNQIDLLKARNYLR